jgi:GntR family transcriptional regulator
LEVLESIETLADRIQLEVSMDDLRIQQIQANLDQAVTLNVREDEQLTKVARIIRADKRPVAYLIDILPNDIFNSSDMNSEFSGSVLDVLLKRGYPPLAYSNTEIRVVDATSDIARELEIQRGDGLLLFIARLYSTSGRVIDYSYSYFLPGYFRFHVVRNVGGVQSPVFGKDFDRR